MTGILLAAAFIFVPGIFDLLGNAALTLLRHSDSPTRDLQQSNLPMDFPASIFGKMARGNKWQTY